MSHWFTAQTDMDDLGLLMEAAEMMGFDAVRADIARGYGSKTASGDVVIKLEGPYDIAANMGNDGKVHLTTDWYRGSVARQVGEDYEYLKDHYAAVKVRKLARKQGKYATIRKRPKQLGGLQVEIRV